MSVSTDPSPHLPEWAESLVASGLAADAVGLLAEALEARPDDPELRVALVQALWASENPVRAMEEIDLTLPLVADDAVRAYLLAIRALSLTTLGRGPEGVTSAHEAARLAPDHPLALLALALVLGSEGDPGAGRGPAERLLELEPDLPDGHLAMAATAPDPPSAEEHLRRAAELAPDDEHVVMWLGATLLEQNRNREALDVLEDAAARHPDSDEARQLALHAAGRIQGTAPSVVAVLSYLAGVLSVYMLIHWGSRVAWPAGALMVGAVLGLAWLRRHGQRSPEPPDIDRLMALHRRKARRAVVVTALAFVAACLVVLPGVWLWMLLAYGIPEGWAEASGANLALLGACMAAGGWLLWRLWQTRRLGPTLVHGPVRSCRCRELFVLTGGDARRYRAHLWSTAAGAWTPEELRCPDSGLRWIGYPVRVGRGPMAERLVRVDRSS